MPATLYRFRFIVLVALGAGCFLTPPNYEGKACDGPHPCPDGYQCAQGKCTQCDGGDCKPAACTPFAPTPCSGPVCVSTFIGNPDEQPRLLNRIISVPDAGVLIAADTYHHQLLELSFDGGSRVIAGTGACGEATSQSLCFPGAVARADDGALYIGDWGTRTIRRLKDGQLSLFFSSSTAGGFSIPLDLAWAQGRLFVAHQSRATVIDVSNQTFFDISLDSSGGGQVHAISVSPNGQTVYVGHEFTVHSAPTNIANGSMASAVVGMNAIGPSLVLGNLGSARFGALRSLAATDDGVYLGDTTFQRLLYVNLTTQKLESAAGTGTFSSSPVGPATSTALASPNALFVDGDFVYIVPRFEERVQRFSRSKKTVEDAVGSALPPADGCWNTLRLGTVGGITQSPVTGTTYFTDTLRNAVLQYTSDGRVSTLTGGGPGYESGTLDKARFKDLSGIVWAPSPAQRPLGQLIVGDSGNGLLRRIDLDVGTVDDLAGNPRGNEPAGIPCSRAVGSALGNARLCTPHSLVRDTDGRVYFIDPTARALSYYEPLSSTIADMTPTGFVGPAPMGLSLRPGGGIWVVGYLVMAEFDGINPPIEHRGDLACSNTNFRGYGYCYPSGVAASKGEVFYSVSEGRAIRRWRNGAGSDYAGKPWEAGYQDGNADSALFASPGIMLAVDGGFLVADNENHRIRFVSH